MRLLIGVVLIAMSGCASQPYEPPKPAPSCAWHIENDDETFLPSRCDTMAFEFARMYIKEHPEIAR